MNDEIDNEMTPELEARIVALVMGEASDFERDDLLRLLEQRPELAAFHAEMQVEDRFKNRGQRENKDRRNKTQNCRSS